MITRKLAIYIYVAIIGGALLLWAGVSLYKVLNPAAEVAPINAGEPLPQKVQKPTMASIDFTQVASYLSSAQQEQVARKVIDLTTITNFETDLPSATIRESSIKISDNPLGKSLDFIIDSETLQVSHAVNRSWGDDFDIVYVTCVEAGDKIYSKDQCYEE